VNVGVGLYCQKTCKGHIEPPSLWRMVVPSNAVFLGSPGFPTPTKMSVRSAIFAQPFPRDRQDHWSPIIHIMCIWFEIEVNIANKTWSWWTHWQTWGTAGAGHGTFLALKFSQICFSYNILVHTKQSYIDAARQNSVLKMSQKCCCVVSCSPGPCWGSWQC